jgi:allantoinase
MARWLCANPARQVSFETRKGSTAVGCDADIVIWNPDAQFTVNASTLHHRHKITPYAGEVLSGVVQQTFLRGRKIYDEGQFFGAPSGRILLR